jgi:hypothetical protein
MTLNPDLVRARCGEINAALTRLEQFQQLTREDFLSNQDQLDIACYRLLVANEASLALCFHVSAKQLHQVPRNMPAVLDCFSTLESSPLTSRLAFITWLDSETCSSVCIGRLTTTKSTTSSVRGSTIFACSRPPSPAGSNAAVHH